MVGEGEGMVYLQLENIWARYSRRGPYVLKGININVKRGEILALLGPSGCGKSTTLKVIAGFVTPTKGRVLIDGKDVTPIPPNRRNIGIVFQSYALFPHMTVFQNVAYGLTLRRMPFSEIRRKVKEVLELVGLSGLENKYPRELSGGQQQRVALARALAIEPKIMLLDEPMSNIDPILRSRLRSDLKGILKKLNITTVYVTHDRDDAFEIADRIAIMKDGVIEQVDTPERLFNKPKTRFVAEFVGVENTFKLEFKNVEETDDHLVVNPASEVYIVLPKHKLSKDILYFGIRPEKLIISIKKPEKPPYIKGRVVVKAFKGVISRFVVETAIGNMVVHTPSGIRNINVGDVVYLSYNIDDILLFSR